MAVVGLQAHTVSSLEKTRQCHDEEKAALLQFKHSFPSTNQCNSSKLESWKEGGHCCSWEGVECDDHYHVVGLDLSQSCLFGSVNSSNAAAIFNLPRLKMLDLSDNPDLSGYLPNFRSGSPLKSLRLYDTSLGGVLPPSIGNLASLEELYIGYCKFTGDLPMSLGNLTQLVYLHISGANLFTKLNGLYNMYLTDCLARWI
ncbi:unnamed protein product [Cuscuta campestris]|uniref:Leucine-rich repeat-containing N-terminal plant-type domain-containing protein n=1 Tax=Cuscuta campestris TaxID=132261 RepID=A0A484KPY0_9ASTE|nr:unnamed protein product [Cuscuta campestris]